MARDRRRREAADVGDEVQQLGQREAVAVVGHDRPPVRARVAGPGDDDRIGFENRLGEVLRGMVVAHAGQRGAAARGVRADGGNRLPSPVTLVALELGEDLAALLAHRRRASVNRQPRGTPPRAVQLAPCIARAGAPGAGSGAAPARAPCRGACCAAARRGRDGTTTPRALIRPHIDVLIAVPPRRRCVARPSSWTGTAPRATATRNAVRRGGHVGRIRLDRLRERAARAERSRPPSAMERAGSAAAPPSSPPTRSTRASVGVDGEPRVVGHGRRRRVHAPRGRRSAGRRRGRRRARRAGCACPPCTRPRRRARGASIATLPPRCGHAVIFQSSACTRAAARERAAAVARARDHHVADVAGEDLAPEHGDGVAGPAATLDPAAHARLAAVELRHALQRVGRARSRARGTCAVGGRLAAVDPRRPARCRRARPRAPRTNARSAGRRSRAAAPRTSGRRRASARAGDRTRTARPRASAWRDDHVT